MAGGSGFRGVEVDQWGLTARGGIDSGDPPDEVRVPVFGSELVHRHRHRGAIPFQAHVKDWADFSLAPPFPRENRDLNAEVCGPGAGRNGLAECRARPFRS